MKQKKLDRKKQHCNRFKKKKRVVRIIIYDE